PPLPSFPTRRSSDLPHDERGNQIRQRIQHVGRRLIHQVWSSDHIDRCRRLRYGAIRTPSAGDDHLLELFTRTRAASWRAAGLLGQGRWVGRDERRRRGRENQQWFHSRSPLVVI